MATESIVFGRTYIYTLNPVYLEVRVTKKIISILKQLIALLVRSDWLLKLGIAIEINELIISVLYNLTVLVFTKTTIHLSVSGPTINHLHFGEYM